MKYHSLSNQKRTTVHKLQLLKMWFFMIVPGRGNLASTLWGLNTPALPTKITSWQGLTLIYKVCYPAGIKRDMANKPSARGLRKTYGNRSLIPEGKAPANMPHAVFSTAWAQADVILPNGFHYFCNRRTGEAGHKFPVPLNPEDDVEVFLLPAIV